MEICVRVGTKISDGLVGQGIQEASYLCCFNKIVADFETKKQDLVAIRRSVQDCTDQAINQTENILADVERWLVKTGNLIEEDTEEKRTCFFGCFPNCIWRYRRGKDLVTKTQDINQLITERKDFKNYSFPSKIPDVEYHSSEHFVPLQSRNLAHNQLLEALKHGNNCVVGLQGIGGAGKTTLAIQVGKEVKEAKLFEYVIKVTVSNTPNIKNIQHEIASPLGLKFENKDEILDRAKKLWQRLTNGEKILIILDDVWEKVDFEEIGIPSSSDHNSCRVLLTTRELKVCKSMGYSTPIELELLSEQDAWVLFQKYAGLGEDSPKTLKNKGREIAKECQGLPVAITTIASNLKDEQKEDWDFALRSLKSIDRKDEELIKVYKRLQVSYDYLKSKEAQGLFLLCSVFPEDYEIPVEDLTLYAIGLGLCEEVNSFEDARVRLHKAKKKLIDSCLLQKVNTKKSVKMHDLLRDMAHWMEKERIRVIMDPRSDLWEADEKKSSLRYLYCHNINDCPDLSDHPKLEILILEFDYKVSVINIPDTFFEGMKDLKVWTLDGFYRRKFQQMPRSIEVLRSLRTLTLSSLYLGDISILEKLQKLQSLRLENCSINEVPSGIVQLKKLKLLSLKKCEIRKNPYEAMGQIVPQLEELYFMVDDNLYGKVDNEVITRFLNKSPQLKRYQIELAEQGELRRSLNGSTSRALSIAHFRASTSKTTVKDLMKRAEILHLQELQGGHKTIIPDFVEAIGAMNELIEIMLKSCSEIEFLIDTTKDCSTVGIDFSKLVKVDLIGMDQLKALCQGPPPSDFLENLQEMKIDSCFQLNFRLFEGNLKLRRLGILHVRDCHKVTSLFTLLTSQNLVLLERLTISHCEALKSIVTDDSEKKGKEIVENDHDQLRLFPILESLRIDGCPQFEGLMSIGSNERQLLDVTASSESQASDSKCSRLFDTPQCLLRQSLISRNIREMRIESCHKLTSLFVVSVLQTMLLEKLHIRSCDGLKHIIIDDSNDHDYKMYNSYLSKLKYLHIQKCSQLKYVFGQSHHENHLYYPYHNTQIQIEFPALEHLHLRELPNIISICQNNYHPKLLALQAFLLVECPQFTITTMSDMGCSVAGQRDCLTIKDSGVIMGQMDTSEKHSITKSQIEGLFCLEGLGVSRQHVISSVKYLKLENLSGMSYIFKGPNHICSLENLTFFSIKGCGKLKVIISTTLVRSLPQLKGLNIADCEALEQIIEDDEENQNITNPCLKQVCFPKLKWFIVQNCNKLKCLLCMNTLNEFPKLEHLLIVGASDLEEVFGGGDQCEREEAMQNNVLPELKHVLLVELPSLTNVWPNKLLTVKYRLVHNCPKLSLTSTTEQMKDLDPLLHCQASMMKEISRGADYVESEDPVFRGETFNIVAVILIQHLLHNFQGEAGSERKLFSSQITPSNKGKEEIIIEEIGASEISTMPSSSASTSAMHDNVFVEKVLKEPISDVAQKTSLQNQSIKGKEKIIIAEIEASDIPTKASASTDSELIKMPSASTSAIHDKELGIEQLMNEACLVNPHPTIGENKEPLEKESSKETIMINPMEIGKAKPDNSQNSIEGSVEESSMPHIAKIVTLSESLRSSPDMSVVSSQDFFDKGSTEPISKDKSTNETGQRVDTPLDVAKRTSLQPSSNQEDRSTSETSERLAKPSSVAQNTSLQSNKETADHGAIDSPKSEKAEDKDGETVGQSVREIANPPSASLIPLQKQSALELVEKNSSNQAITMDQMAFGKTKYDNIKENVQDVAKIVTSSQMEGSTSGLLIASFPETSLQDFVEKGSRESIYKDGVVQQDRSCNEASERLEKTSDIAQETPSEAPSKYHQTGTYLDQDTIENSLDLQNLKGDIFSLFDSMEKDNQLVDKAFANLETYLNMSLKDIAKSESNINGLVNALKFLSSWSSENGSSLEAPKATIDSLLRNLPSLLSSFKQASDTIDKFTALEEKHKSVMEELPRCKEAANTLEKSIVDAQQRKAYLKEKFDRLQAELKSTENDIKEHEDHLLSLEDQKEKLHGKTVNLFKEFETIKKNKSEMVGDRSKAHEQLLEANYEWIAFSNQLKQKCCVSRNLF